MKRIILAASFAVATAFLARTQTVEAGKGWISELDHATKQLVSLAEVTPADKFAWRPAPGVRSTSEVYMHISVGNYFLLTSAGLDPAGFPKRNGKTESTVTAKEDVIKWLKDSSAALHVGYLKADRQKKVKFFGAEVEADAVFLRALVHNHEHMGQLIGYARMNGIVPPWSAPAK